MDRDHSSLIIILLGGILFVLGGILFVLLVGRDRWRSPSSAVRLGSRWWSARLRCSSATYVASVGRVSRGCFTSFYGPPTLEFLRFLALLPSILPTMPAAALMSALGEFRFIGSRPRLCS